MDNTHPFYQKKYFNNNTIDNLTKIWKKNKTFYPNSLIIYGPEGNNKSSNIIQLIEIILETNNLNCDLVRSLTHPDLFFCSPFYEINSFTKKKSVGQITVDEIRELNHFSLSYPSYSYNKVIYIDNAEHLNINASNALLKLMEESSQNVIILLITSNINKITPTIISRCSKWYYNPLTRKDFYTAISDLYSENILLNKNYINDDNYYNINKIVDNSVFIEDLYIFCDANLEIARILLKYQIWQNIIEEILKKDYKNEINLKNFNYIKILYKNLLFICNKSFFSYNSFSFSNEKILKDIIAAIMHLWRKIIIIYGPFLTYISLQIEALNKWRSLVEEVFIKQNDFQNCYFSLASYIEEIYSSI
ncbi:AAA family ATPase [Lyticum sinuosum]|uniref:DNA polymerase III subunit delta n=1 Tax=Lyticum sinuosum TaxID=1332059 RepID=A0AAE4VLR2_9RICK|nr:AAA family ATPase [Lyticum sinuosum]MDZ5760948.1 DNA polymerase III subunit delta' [Lyticum sinuosum]